MSRTYLGLAISKRFCQMVGGDIDQACAMPGLFSRDAPKFRVAIFWLMQNDFDLASSKCMRRGEGEGHAVAYVHRRVLDQGQPVPVAPVFINT